MALFNLPKQKHEKFQSRGIQVNKPRLATLMLTESEILKKW